VEGRLLLAGVQAHTLTFRQLCAVVLAIRVDGHPFAERDQALKAYNEHLAKSLFPERSRWGITTEEWNARMAAMPPAPLRDPSAQRPVRQGDS
jgi:hypothetical protein